MPRRIAKPKQRMTEHEVAVIGEIFEEGESEIIEALLGVPVGADVTVYIDSAGGSVYAAMAIATLIEIRRLRASAVVLSECSSSAIVIFAACKRRLVTPRSVFLFHRVRWRSEKDVRSEEAANWAEHFRWLEGEADRFQAERLGISVEECIRWTNDGRFVLGTEMVERKAAQWLEVGS